MAKRLNAPGFEPGIFIEGPNPSTPAICRHDAIGRRTRLKLVVLWVQIPWAAPNMWGVVQLVRTPGCGPGGHEFNSHHSIQTP